MKWLEWKLKLECMWTIMNLFNPILAKYQAENQVHTQYQQQYIAIFFSFEYWNELPINPSN